MPRTYKKKIKSYTEATVELAVNQVLQGVGILKTAKQFGMSHGLLHSWVLEKKGAKNAPKKAVSYI